MAEPSRFSTNVLFLPVRVERKLGGMIWAGVETGIQSMTFEKIKPLFKRKIGSYPQAEGRAGVFAKLYIFIVPPQRFVNKIRGY